MPVFYLNTPRKAYWGGGRGLRGRGIRKGGRGKEEGISLLLSSGYFTCNIFYLDEVYRTMLDNLIIFYML